MSPRQLSFLPRQLPPEHGGELVRGKRKTTRAIATRDGAMHVVLRSRKARGEWSMLHRRNRTRVDDRVREIARRHGIRLYRYANVGNHLHLLVKTPTRTAFQRFLKDLGGTIAVLVTGAKNGQPLENGRTGAASPGIPESSRRKFWDGLAYTRIVHFGRDFRNLEQYFIKNLFEAAGLLTRKAKEMGLGVIPIIGWGAVSS